jgi:hypothetical protein
MRRARNCTWLQPCGLQPRSKRDVATSVRGFRFGVGERGYPRDKTSQFPRSTVSGMLNGTDLLRQPPVNVFKLEIRFGFVRSNPNHRSPLEAPDSPSR